MAPSEVLDGKRCRSLIGWFELGKAKLIKLDLVKDVIMKVMVIRERLQVT